METIKSTQCHKESGWFTGDRVSCSSGGSSLPWESELFCKHTNAATAAADAHLNIYEPLGLHPNVKKASPFTSECNDCWECETWVCRETQETRKLTRFSIPYGSRHGLSCALSSFFLNKGYYYFYSFTWGEVWCLCRVLTASSTSKGCGDSMQTYCFGHLWLE